MYLKILFIFAIIALMKAELDPRDLIDEARELLTKLQQYSQSLQNGTLSTLQTYYDTIGSRYEYYLQGAIDNLQFANEQLLSEVDDIKSAAADAGIDISNCLEGREDELTNDLPVSLKNDLTLCFEGLTEAAQSFLLERAAELKTFSIQVNDIENELENCSDDTCIANVVGEISNINRLLPLDVLKVINDVVMYQGSWHMILRGCDDTQSSRMSVLGQRIVDEIAQCAEDA